MSIPGTIYGVVLNDGDECARLGDALSADPYKAPPQAPVVYIKPRLCVTLGGAPVPLPQGEERLRAGATLGLLFVSDACRILPGEAMDHVGGACLALDIAVPFANYYRPPIAQICRDGFLPLGTMGAPVLPDEIVTEVDGKVVHSWSLAQLVRGPSQLISDLSQFMTLRAGDLLLVGLPGDAPLVGQGQTVHVRAPGLAPIATRIEAEVV